MEGVQLAQHAATVALNLSVALAVGASLSAAWLSCRTSHWAVGRLPGVWSSALAGIVVALFASTVLLCLEAALMAEVPLSQAVSAAVTVATETHYGYAWRIGAVALAGAMVCAATGLVARRRSFPGYAALLAFAVFLYSRSMVSHAASAGDVSWAIAVDWLHLVLISVWVGEVFIAGTIALATIGASKEDRHDCAAYVTALSSAATFALIGIVATGAFSAWRNLGGMTNLTGNPYSTALLIKLCCVGVAVALGGLNRWVIMPTLIRQLLGADTSATKSARKFVFILQVEAVALLLVLVFAALLSSTAPPTAA